MRSPAIYEGLARETTSAPASAPTRIEGVNWCENAPFPIPVTCLYYLWLHVPLVRASLPLDVDTQVGPGTNCSAFFGKNG